MIGKTNNVKMVESKNTCACVDWILVF